MPMWLPAHHQVEHMGGVCQKTHKRASARGHWLLMTDTSKEIELISDSLELYTERHGDMVPRVYERFFELNSEAAALMACSDEYMRGRMFASMIELFLSDEHLEPGGYLTWELENHIKAYSATTAMHESLFQSIRNVLDRDLGADWRPEGREAWANRIYRIMVQVDAFK